MSTATPIPAAMRRRAAVVIVIGFGVIVAVSVALAVVGWLQDARPDDPEPVTVGEPFRIGDFEFVVTGAHIVDDADGVYLPRDDDGETDPDVRALIASVEVTNVGDAPWLGVTATSAVHAPDDAGIVGDANDDTDGAALFSADGHLVDVLNPGVTIRGTYGWAQDRGWRGDEITLRFTELRWVEHDPLTLDDRRWAATDRLSHTVTVPVEMLGGQAP
ncbi:hypothetical protein [Microbacterium halotolerans]|uniref:hypothetical protein n=1 Tax=Microbacterium halotolerans TaxID=246613 RepID=UPI000E6A9FBE|nr:hypothetical protein [Microbacterium halotolerans]